MADYHVPEVPEQEGERCYNFAGMQDDANARKAFERAADAGESQAKKCVSCNGRRCDAIKLDCWSYIALRSGRDLAIRKPDLGFVSSNQLSEARKKAEHIKALEKELRELKETENSLGEGGIMRITSLEKQLAQFGGEDEK